MPIVMIAYFLMPSRVRYIWLLFASYFFYMNWNSKYALILVFVTVISYVSARKMQIINESRNDECRQMGQIPPRIYMHHVLRCFSGI